MNVMRKATTKAALVPTQSWRYIMNYLKIRVCGAGILACLMLLVAVLTGTATAHAEGLKPVCSSATETTVQCMSFEITGVVSFEGGGEKGGLSPENLRSAYKLPASGGKEPEQQTVAIVDAYNDPNAESDLKKYREKYKLPECTESNKCLKKVNQKGEVGSYPANESGWSVEMSLDLDMVSAICSECHILLVEATSDTYSNMETAENEAATLKATEISDSWGGPERSGETSEDSSFEHSGIPITVAAGDECYINECEGLERPNWPATSPHVIAVGGTKLEKASNSRGWSESVWDEPESEYGAIGTGSGCSLYESKPSYETGSSCSKRTDDDVAAVAACKSPLSIYDSYEREGWFVECGTSAASPIVAGVEALSTSEARKDGPELFGKLASQGKLFDVTEGHNWDLTNCGTYLCNAEVGYDGPTGNGTPDGAFALHVAPTVTTGSASSVTEVGATLNGTVNPQGLEAKYYFEYGETESYGSKTAEASAGAGESKVEESKAVTGLTLGTTYDFRIVATNADGTTYGNNLTLKTPVEWRQGGAVLSESVGTKSKGTVKLADEAATGGELEVECEAAGEGSVGPGGVDEETKWSKSKCTLVKTGSCEAGKAAELVAVHLPWHSETLALEGTVRDVITSSGKGTPGLEIVCTVAGIFKVVDECTGTLKTGMTNVAGGVDATFDGEKLKCSSGGAGKGALEGTELIEATKGGKLEVSAPEWRQGGAVLSESVGTKSKGTVKLTDEAATGGELEVECEAAGEGSVGPGGVDEETKWSKSKCTLVKTGSCEAGKAAELVAVHLPWHSETLALEGTVRDVITSSGKGTPGLEIVCTVAGIFKVVDECTGTLKTGMTNVAGGVDATFDGEKLKCSSGGAGKGALEGTELIEATKGSTLEAVT